MVRTVIKIAFVSIMTVVTMLMDLVHANQAIQEQYVILVSNGIAVI